MTFTLTGTVKSPTAVVLSGTARVTPLAPILDTANNFVFTGPVSAALASGAFSFTLPDSSIASGYQLEVLDTTGAPMFAPVTFGAGASNTTLDLSDLINTTPVVAVPTTYTAVINYSGSGFPEGVVTAPVGSRYVDTAATSGAVQWTKVSGSGNTGWKVTHGDTGWRRFDAPTNDFASGSVYLRRVNGTVHVKFAAAVMNAGSGYAYWWATAGAIPTGFGPFRTSGMVTKQNNAVDLERVTFDCTIGLFWVGSGVGSGGTRPTSSGLHGEFSGHVDPSHETWPSTLPGT